MKLYRIFLLSGMSDESGEDPLRDNARKAKEDFFAESTATQICAGLIGKFLPLSADDLALWDADPEEYGEGFSLHFARERQNFAFPSCVALLQFLYLLGVFSQIVEKLDTFARRWSVQKYNCLCTWQKKCQYISCNWMTSVIKNRALIEAKNFFCNFDDFGKKKRFVREKGSRCFLHVTLSAQLCSWRPD